MPETGIRKTEIVSALLKSPHGKLSDYLPIGLKAASEDPDFFAHLIAFNALKGQIRDAKVALPIIGLKAGGGADYLDNSLGHIASLRPREFLKAVDFAREAKAPSRQMRRLVERYLRELETDRNRWERTALQHRATLKTLYARFHIKPAAFADEILLKGQARTGRFAAIRTLPGLSPEEIAGTMASLKLPFLIVRGALGARAKEPEVLTALIGRMSPTELTTNLKALERLGMRDIPAARAAFEAALEAASGSKKATLKTSKAAEAVEESDPKLAAKLKALQERQIDALGGIKGRWLVLADKSGSMQDAIAQGREVAALLARMAESIHLVFFDTSPRYVDATNKPLEEIPRLTRGITAGGGTSIGCGLQYCLERGIEVDGIAILSDGDENNPPSFFGTYDKYVAKMGLTPTIYWYKMGRHAGATRLARPDLDVQTFDLRGGDYYSIPNLVQTMRVGRYSLLDEILAAPLMTLDEALPRTAGLVPA